RLQVWRQITSVGVGIGPQYFISRVFQSQRDRTETLAIRLQIVIRVRNSDSRTGMAGRRAPRHERQIGRGFGGIVDEFFEALWHSEREFGDPQVDVLVVVELDIPGVPPT